MVAHRPVPHGDDEMLPHEDRGVAVGDAGLDGLVLVKMHGARDREQMIAERLDLGEMPVVKGILDRQRMQLQLLLDWRQFILGRFVQADPQQFAPCGNRQWLRQIDIGQLDTIAVQARRNDGHPATTLTHSDLIQPDLQGPA